jgi:adenylyltransferase/sulfurtransferase
MDINRYKKNILVEDIGEKGQKKLLSSRVAIIGVGGLGSAVATYLAAVGIGELILVEFDSVELINLQRQVIYDEESIGQGKADVAKERLRKLNSDVSIKTYNSPWEEVKEQLIKDRIDIIVDCVDNFKAKFALNDFAVANKIPLIHAGVVALGGQIITIVPGQTGCLRCLFPDRVPEETSSNIHGILGPVAGNMGTMQAIEVIKYLTGSGNGLINRILFMDYRNSRFRTVEYQRNDSCRVCSDK